MPSAFFSGRSWVASFRGLNSRGQRRVRIKLAQVAAVDDDEHRGKAVAYAEECEIYCRRMESSRDGHDVAHALRIGAITEDQASALRQGEMAEPQELSRTPTILEAAQLHPASGREPLDQQKRHERDLKEFLKWARIERLSALRLEHFTEYIKHLHSLGRAYDTRRHALMWAKRAAAIAPQYSLPDPIAGVTLDRREEAPEGVQSWTPEEIARAAIALDPEKQGGDHRPRLALLLGGFLGLRPSEEQRSQVGDAILARDLLAVGVRKRKNRASRRTLPLPSIAVEWLTLAVAGRDPSEPLIRSRLNKSAPRPFAAPSWSRWLRGILATATGRDLDPKSLRKTWTTIALAAGVEPRLLEAYVGHKTQLVGTVTADHYLADLLVEELRPVAAKLDSYIRALLATQLSDTRHKSLQKQEL